MAEGTARRRRHGHRGDARLAHEQPQPRRRLGPRARDDGPPHGRRGSGIPNFCFNGTSDLPGPLCHDFLARSGRLHLVGNGRANHAGKVAANAYDAVLNERATHPKPGPDALDGNTVSYGLEVENSGAADRTWPAVQYDVAVRVEAARCRFHGWSADSVWAHKEATTRKPVDPRIPMDPFRAAVAERLKHPASWNPGGAESPEEDEVTEAQMNAIADKVVDRLFSKDAFPAPKDASDYSPDPKSSKHRWTGWTAFNDLITRVRRISNDTAAIRKKLDA